VACELQVHPQIPLDNVKLCNVHRSCEYNGLCMRLSLPLTLIFIRFYIATLVSHFSTPRGKSHDRNLSTMDNNEIKVGGQVGKTAEMATLPAEHVPAYSEKKGYDDVEISPHDSNDDDAYSATKIYVPADDEEFIDPRLKDYPIPLVA